MDSQIGSSFDSLTNQQDPSSFQSSSPGFMFGVRTPLSASGYKTPGENDVDVCGSCDKVFRIKSTYTRHVKSCSFRRNLKKKRKLDFRTTSGKKRDLFQECSSSSDDDNDVADFDENTINEQFVSRLEILRQMENDILQVNYPSVPSDISDEDDVEIETEESESESNVEEHDKNPCHWSGISLEEMMEDLETQPLPPPNKPVSKVQKTKALIEWMCFFLVYWQLMCHVSDNGLEWLLSFVYQFLHVVNYSVDSAFLRDMLILFPTTMYMVRKLIKLDRDNFTKYVACPKCKSIYNLHQCTKINGHGETVAVQCSNKVFHRQGTALCGAPLVKEVILGNGSKVFYPLKTYCYNSIINQLEQMLKRPGFPNLCEKWRNREKIADVLYDVFDGEIWKSFCWKDGSLLFGQERRYGLMMNVDWFQPFKRRTDYSVGVIYFVVMNLPRQERFKLENVIIAGIIPPFEKEPCLNRFLEPVVEELNSLWKGISLSSSLSVIPLKFVAALLCVAADVPAARKACGFKSHAANKGCSKCIKKFPGGFGVKKDYSGFARQNWTKRCVDSHRRYSRKLNTAKCKKDYDLIAKKYGIHYSVLVTLEYFDPVRYHVIDPMHNLFLGIAKKTWKIWKDNYFSKQQLALIDRKTKEMNISTDVGRIGSKISSNYGMFTAQEWKNWTNIHSMHVLSGILPAEHLLIWERFVLASRILCQPVITKTEIMKADALLVNFCKGYEKLYGKLSITPNMHLCCHLKECLFDFGPVYAFWLFSFERYNGELAANISNNRSVEIQYMRKFITSSHVHPQNGNVPPMYQEEFEQLFYRGDNNNIDSAGEPRPLTTYFSSTTRNLQEILWHSSSTTMSPQFVEDALDVEDKALLCEVYNTMFPGRHITEDKLSQFIYKHTHLLMAGERYGSVRDCRTRKSAFLMASWLNSDGNIDPGNALMRPAVVSHYFTHNVQLDGDGGLSKFTFAVIQWNTKSPSSSFDSLRVLWKANEFETGGSRTFLPVQRIHCRIVQGIVKNEHSTYFIACPVTRKVCT